MPLRLLIAYFLIALVVASLTAVYLHLTRDQRAFRRGERAYRRAHKARRKAGIS
jgi:uncharacterized iron-regulated membrane protein